MKSIEGLTADEERAAAIFRALGNPARIRIVTELAQRNTCVTGDLVGILPLAQSTVSQHLKVLKDAGIVRGTIEGGDACYCLDPETMSWVASFAQEICGPGCGVCMPGASGMLYDLLVPDRPAGPRFYDLTGASPERYAALRAEISRPATPAEIEQGAQLIERLRNSRELLSAARGGDPFPDAWLQEALDEADDH